MKKLLVIFVLVVAVLLSACGQKSYQVASGGKVYTVDPEAHTVSDGSYRYSYQLSGSRDTYTLRITYPNGMVYLEQKNDMMTGSSWSTENPDSRYASSDTLSAVITRQLKKDMGASIGGCIVLLAAGLWALLAPYSLWKLSFGWRYANAEPSDAALLVNRICGGVLIVLGIAILFI